MILDSKVIASGQNLTADICIIGGGAASIALCLSLHESGLKTIILESGGLDREADTQDLAVGTQSGEQYFALEDCRYRLLGGSTYRWGARTTPLKPIDFKQRPFVPLSGWPIGLEDLQPYFDDAVRMVGSSPGFAYDAGIWEQLGLPATLPNKDKLQVTAFQFGKNLLLGDVYRRVLQEAPHVELYLHANAVDLVSSPSNTKVERVMVKTLAGGTFSVTAKRFVLACGGIENARLLLAAKSLIMDRNMVGRCFMEHPTLSAGRIHTTDPNRAMDLFSPGLIKGRLVETGWALSDTVQLQKQTLNVYGRIVAVAGNDPTQALREILWNVKHRRLPLQLSWYGKNKWLLEKVGTVLSDPISIVSNIIRHRQGKPKRFKIDGLNLELRCEQAPHMESRVSLSSEVDALGMPRPHLHWHLTEQERHTFRTAARIIGAELETMGIGTLELADWLIKPVAPWPTDLVGGHHHMGTTRMASAPSEGVVDANCKVHGIDNFYIAGSSVFPTSGFANPTATLLALAYRLGDHLKKPSV
jgi:choline dehydrogenase-like flavoprotein